MQQDSPIINLKWPWTDSQLLELQANQIQQLLLCITESCNLRCSYCSYSGFFPNRREHTAHNLSITKARRAIEWYVSHSRGITLPSIGFYGGEPLLLPEVIFELTRYADELFKNRPYLVRIITNGTLLNDEFVNWLERNNHVNLVITLNGPEHIHNRYRCFGNGLGSHSHIMRGIKCLQTVASVAYYKRVRFSCNFDSWVDLPEQINWYLRSEVIGSRLPDALHAIRHPDNYHINKTDLKNAKAKELLEKEYVESRAVNKEHWMSIFWNWTLELLHTREMTRLPNSIMLRGSCPPLVSVTYVDTNGNFRLCEKADCGPILGNVETGIDNPAIEQLLKSAASIFIKYCCSCWAVRLCRICLADCLEKDRFSEPLLNHRCEAMRRSIRREMKMYVSIREINDHAFLESANN